MTEVIKYDLALPVTIRKYPVDIEALRSLLRNAKQNSKITNRQLAQMIGRPVTEVEHWFRTDNCFSIPDAALWHELKEILDIQNTDFDLAVTTFEEKDGVFEKANRFYDIEGIAPTLTAASADEKIIVDVSKLKKSRRLENTCDLKYEQKEFKYVSLFSGVGGFESALNKFGAKCVMASEIDKFANEAYKVLYGYETVGDVTKVNEKEVPDHELLVGGMPCQSFSVAGLRKGFEDTRGTLFFDALRIAKEKMPRAIFLENVKGLVNHDKGKTLEVMLTALSEIGYTVDFEVLDSKYFGVAQRRERIYIIAVRNDLVATEEWNVLGSNVVAKRKKIIREDQSIRTFNFNWPQQLEATTRLIDIIDIEVDENLYLSEDKTNKLLSQLEERYYSPDVSKLKIRKISTKECFRLQGFTDEQHDKLKYYSKEEDEELLTKQSSNRSFSDKERSERITNSQLYKLSGNAVTVNVIEAIGKNLLKYL